ncbi:MAG: hypothetical protein K2O89_07235 [Clostridia bacterium]|nr:hypothetical protein [Clostridia bacterium]
MAKETRKKLSKRIIALIVCGVFILCLAIIAFGLQIAFWVSDGIRCIQPDYEMIDLDGYLDGEITDEDYEVLYRQTGLTKIGIDRALEKGETGKKLIKKIQADFFEPHTVMNGQVAPYACTDYIETHISNIYLEDGDIIVTSSTHISSVRIGHAGLVTNGSLEKVLQANAYGTYSRIGNIWDFTDRVNFLILRPDPEKISSGVVKNVVEYAQSSLVGIPYEGLAGVVTNKNNIERTQCAHIIWYAYKQFGIDLDSNGGSMVVPYDLANSAYLQPVQVFGFDLDELWR